MQERELQWHLDGSACTWNVTRGEGVIVAVMDTGPLCVLSLNQVQPDLRPWHLL